MKAVFCPASNGLTAWRKARPFFSLIVILLPDLLPPAPRLMPSVCHLHRVCHSQLCGSLRLCLEEFHSGVLWTLQYFSCLKSWLFHCVPKLSCQHSAFELLNFPSVSLASTPSNGTRPRALRTLPFTIPALPPLSQVKSPTLAACPISSRGPLPPPGTYSLVILPLPVC